MLLVGLMAYLALGCVIALVKIPGTDVCPEYHGPSGFTVRDESCRPITGADERLRFVGSVVPTWPYLVAQEGIGPRVRP